MKTLKTLASLPLLLLLAVQEGIDERARLAPKVKPQITVALPDQSDKRGPFAVTYDWLKSKVDEVKAHDAAPQSVGV